MTKPRRFFSADSHCVIKMPDYHDGRYEPL